jgi:glycosyltransferase involved in cell wall biosynthesis
LFFEIHVPPSHWLGRVLVRHFDAVLPVSRILARELVDAFRVDETRILVAHMGTNLRLIEDVRLDKTAARRRLGLPLDRNLAVYTGKVHVGSGEIEFLIEAAQLLGDEAYVVIVGGREDHVQKLREQVANHQIQNIIFPGFVAPVDVFHWQMAADVLLTYYPSDLALNKYRASPGKLFEYMASRRPIVTADYPALREALSPQAALFVPKDDVQALVRGIRMVLRDEVLAHNLAEQAYADVQDFGWERRAERIIRFAERLRNAATFASGIG